MFVSIVIKGYEKVAILSRVSIAEARIFRVDDKIEWIIPDRGHRETVCNGTFRYRFQGRIERIAGAIPHSA